MMNRIDEATNGSQVTVASCASAAITVRSVNADDAGAYHSILERTSEEDRYCRFFHIVNHFDLNEIKRFVEPRGDTVGFIAEDESGPLGVAHAFFISSDAAEIAIVVASDVRCRHVGHQLLERLIEALVERRCKNVRAFSLSHNNAFAHLARSVGMTPVGPPVDMMTTWALAVSAP